jgi:hypothetical protein
MAERPATQENALAADDEDLVGLEFGREGPNGSFQIRQRAD